MSAHLRDLPQPKCLTCHGRATVELYNTRNSALGTYCRRDGAKALKQKLAEDERLSAST